MTPLDEFSNGVWVKRESHYRFGWKERAIGAVPDKPHLVVSCGNWGEAVLHNRPGSVMLKSADYSLIDAYSRRIAEELMLPIAEFEPRHAASLFTEVHEQLGHWPEAFVSPASGFSMLRAARIAGVPDHVLLLGACTSYTPNLYNISFGTVMREVPGSHVPALYCAGGVGIPRYRYPWWDRDGFRQEFPVAIIEEDQLVLGVGDLSPYGRLAYWAAQRLINQEIVKRPIRSIVAVETA